MTEEPNSPDAEPNRLDATRPLPTEMLNPGRGQASVPSGPYAGQPALVAPVQPKPVPVAQPPVAAQPPFAAQPSLAQPPLAQPPFAAQPPVSAPPVPQPPQHYAPAPLPVPVQQGPGPILVQLGEVSVTSTTILTPAGPIPLRGSQWQVTDQWQAQHKIPTWAIVCTVLLFFGLCFLSLFFLLAKETRYTGTVQVVITNGHRQYVARIPVTDQRVVQHVNAQVNYVRSLAAM